MKQNEVFNQAVNDWWEGQGQDTEDPENPYPKQSIHDYLLNAIGQPTEAELQEVLEGMGGL